MPSVNVAPGRAPDPAAIAEQLPRARRSTRPRRDPCCSSSCPSRCRRESLLRLAQQAKRADARARVPRAGRARRSARWSSALQPLAKTGAAIQINPEAFARFGIEVVPTFVLADSAASCGDRACEGRRPPHRGRRHARPRARTSGAHRRPVRAGGCRAPATRCGEGGSAGPRASSRCSSSRALSHAETPAEAFAQGRGLGASGASRARPRDRIGRQCVERAPVLDRAAAVELLRRWQRTARPTRRRAGERVPGEPGRSRPPQAAAVRRDQLPREEIDGRQLQHRPERPRCSSRPARSPATRRRSSGR